MTPGPFLAPQLSLVWVCFYVWPRDAERLGTPDVHSWKPWVENGRATRQKGTRCLHTVSLNHSVEEKHLNRYTLLEKWKKGNLWPCYAIETAGVSWNDYSSPGLSLSLLPSSHWVTFYFHSLWVQTLHPPCNLFCPCPFCLAFNFTLWWLRCLWPAWCLTVSRYPLFPFMSRTLCIPRFREDGHASYQKPNAGSCA